MSLPGAARPALGAASVALLDAASEGDSIARRAIREVAGQVGDMVRAASSKVGLASPTPVVLSGGLFRHSCTALVDALASELPGSELVRARFEPAAGALLLAFDELGAAPELARLEATLPPDEFFASLV
jgi:N-acetylglucosamine kinase-like BadF-type ATPase